MSPQQLTALNLDKTGMLDQILQQHFSGDSDELLGELQFSFLAFLMGQSLEGEQNSTCCNPEGRESLPSSWFKSILS